MNKQLSREEFERRIDAVVADYPQVPESRWACAGQNAELCLVDVEGYDSEDAYNDQSELFIEYFAMSMAGFAEDLENEELL
jgi:hypothetical protein